MVFRDQESSFRKLAAVSYDRGETWSKAVETAFPDSRSKQCAGNFPDGTPFLIGNPGPRKDRSLLILATASDGETFAEAWILRDNPPERRFEGKAKTQGYSYPKAYVDEDFLYVAYSVNKEEIAVTRLKWPIRPAME
jgi:predicted neuraminidase